MRKPTLLACALLAAPGWLYWPSALAQTGQATPSVADPAVPVPATLYRTVFAAPGHADPAPLDWRQANADVGQFRRGHLDLLKWEKAQPDTMAPGAKAPAPRDSHQ